MDEYRARLGKVIQLFATLEWNIVYCLDRIQSGYIVKTLGQGDGRRTAEQICSDFEQALNSNNALNDQGLKDELLAFVPTFRCLIRECNSLLQHISSVRDTNVEPSPDWRLDAGANQQGVLRSWEPHPCHPNNHDYWTNERLDGLIYSLKDQVLASNQLYHRMA